MTCLATSLSRLGPSIEGQLKPHLSGLFGGVVRGYLPQTWVFAAGSESASLVVDQAGNVTVYSGAVQSADVLITATHATLSGALEAATGVRRRDEVPSGPVKPTFYTSKGRTAFNYLRGKFGL
jgi:hypothetical protein